MSHFGEIATGIMRTYEEECAYLEQLTNTHWKIKKGFVPNMSVEGSFYVQPGAAGARLLGVAPILQGQRATGFPSGAEADSECGGASRDCASLHRLA